MIPQTTIPPSSKRDAPGTVLSPLALSHPTKRQRSPPEMSPKLLLRSIFGNAGLVNTTSPKSFMKPTEEEIEAYDLEVVRTIRMGDLAKLQQLYNDGKDLNASNQFGESLLHMACRRGNIDILKFMLREAKVRVDRQDDFGRNPLHDACWTSSPNYDVMDELLQFVDPFMLLAEDVRGSTPFDYVRRNHWRGWVNYLGTRQDQIQARIRQVQLL